MTQRSLGKRGMRGPARREYGGSNFFLIEIAVRKNYESEKENLPVCEMCTTLNPGMGTLSPLFLKELLIAGSIGNETTVPASSCQIAQ